MPALGPTGKQWRGIGKGAGDDREERGTRGVRGEVGQAALHHESVTHSGARGVAGGPGSPQLFGFRAAFCLALGAFCSVSRARLFVFRYVTAQSPQLFQQYLTLRCAAFLFQRLFDASLVSGDHFPALAFYPSLYPVIRRTHGQIGAAEDRVVVPFWTKVPQQQAVDLFGPRAFDCEAESGDSPFTGDCPDRFVNGYSGDSRRDIATDDEGGTRRPLIPSDRIWGRETETAVATGTA